MGISELSRIVAVSAKTFPDFLMTIEEHFVAYCGCREDVYTVRERKPKLFTY
jgi:hypothetical protein